MPAGSVSSILENPYITQDEVNPNRKTPRRPFRIEKAPNPSNETEKLTQASTKFKTLLEQGAIKQSMFGQATINNLVQFMERIGIGAQRSPTYEQRTAIANIYKYYEDIFGEDFDIVRVGALAEFAVMSSLSRIAKTSKMPLSVVHSTPEEDLYKGADFLVKNEADNSVSAFQVKCIGMPKKPSHLIYPIYDQNSLKESVDTIIDNSWYTHDPRKAPQRDRALGKLSGSGERLLEFTDDEASSTNKAFIVVPSPDNNSALFNSFSGIPSEELFTQLYQDFHSQILVPNTQLQYA